MLSPRLILSLISIGITVLALILIIVTISVPEWYSESSGNIGLFKSCYSELGISVCGSSGDADWVKASRAFGILSVLCIVGTVACLGLLLWLKKELMLLVAMGTAGASVFCLLICTGVFVGKFNSEFGGGVDYGACFFLAILSIILGISDLIVMWRLRKAMMEDEVAPTA